MKPATSIIVYGLALAFIFLLGGGVVLAQIIQPQALDKSGLPTIRPPSVPSFSGTNNLTTPSSNSSQLKSLEAAGLPTNHPPASIVVSEDGNTKIKNAVVFQIAGNTLFVRTYWDETFLRWVIRTNDKIQIVKRFNGSAKLSDIALGHVLNIDGTLLPGSETFNLNATTIRDFSLENENGTFSGKVIKVDSATSDVTIAPPSGISLIIKFNSGATIKKGAIYLQPSQIVVGDNILSVAGSYNQPTESIMATNVEVYQDPSIFMPHNFEGKLKGLSGTTLPATFTLVLKSKEYNIVMSDKTIIMNTKRETAKLQRFVEGDTIRVYGQIRNTDLTTVDAEVVRNIDL